LEGEGRVVWRRIAHVTGAWLGVCPGRGRDHGNLSVTSARRNSLGVHADRQTDRQTDRMASTVGVFVQNSFAEEIIIGTSVIRGLMLLT
jgi:hypothetical protein